MINWQDQFTSLEDLDRCCLQARQQGDCQQESKENLDWVCGSDAGLQLWLNNKAYNYCKQQPYW